MNLWGIRPIQIDMENIDLFSDIGYGKNYFQEAVFTKGKEKLKKLDEAWKPLQEKLRIDVETQKKQFSPEKFNKDHLWKDLEDVVKETFGFRHVGIEPVKENYQNDTDYFVYVNAYTNTNERYPIDGLVTADGFYDKTHSLVSQVHIGCKLLMMLTAEELTAVFLHEMGHNIDPALVDINYSNINEYSKYMENTEKNKPDANPFKHLKVNPRALWLCLFSVFWFFGAFGLAALSAIGAFVTTIISNLRFYNPFFRNTNLVAKKLAKQTAKDIKKEGLFSKEHNIEAFADNLPRMYGYASHLLTALNKMQRYCDDKMIEMKYGKNALNRKNIEKLRGQLFAITMSSAIKNVHKTEVHRYYSILKEYQKDLKDKNIPADVKKEIKRDMDQVLKLAELYFDSPDVVKNKIYTNIYYAILENDPDAFNPKNLDPKEVVAETKEDSKELKADSKEIKKEIKETKQEAKAEDKK